MAYFSGRFEDLPEKEVARIRALFSPERIEQLVDNAIRGCWMGLPTEKKTLEEFEATIREIFERSIQNFRDNPGPR